MGALFPESIAIQQKIKAQGSNTDEIGELAFAAQRVGFLCGVLVGMRSEAAMPQQLLEKARGFIIPALSRAEAEFCGKAMKNDELVEDFRQHLIWQGKGAQPSQTRTGCLPLSRAH